MSTLTLWMKLFLFVILISHAIVTNVEGIPAKKKPPKIVKKTTPVTTKTKVLPKFTRSIKNPNTRDPRFLGKLSFVAGLNLPNLPTISPNHRNGVAHKQHVPMQYVTTYNFPPSSWGPFAAAIYEPPPIPSFLEDPVGYLAAILNPYNWFNNTFATTNIPTTFVPDQNQDEMVLIVEDSDNEILNEEHMDHIEMKAGHHNVDKRKYTTKRIPFELSTTTRQYTTVTYDEESDSDLIVEETTIKPFEKIRIDKDFEKDSRYFGRKSTSRKTKPTMAPTKFTAPHTRPTTPEKETTVVEHITLPTYRPNSMNISSSNSSMGIITNTSQTPYPLNNVTYPIYHHGFYYGGNPRNVSHIELTTFRMPHIDQQIQSLHDVNQYLQPYQASYYDFDEPQNRQALNFAKHFEQLPPSPKNYYDKTTKFTFNNMNDSRLNGFKPSFPLNF